MTRLPFAVLLAIFAAACSGGAAMPGGSADGAAPAKAAERARSAPVPVPPGCYRGRLTGDGETCQAMRTEDGKLLTLGGPRRGFATGDRVCVCGVRAPEQFCAQGLTVVIREISDTCADIR